MDFADAVKAVSAKVSQWHGKLENEEATKVTLVLPLIQALGYDIFNPDEVWPEYTADVGRQKAEKVDYAILKDGHPEILIECKSITEDLDEDSPAYKQAWKQLYWYFSALSRVKFAVLTNGRTYRFFTDLEDKNKLDDKAFLEVDLMDLDETLIPELKKFHKASFDRKHILSTASQLKYEGEIKHIIAEEWGNPSDDFVKFLVRQFYDGMLTQKRVEWFKPIVKTTLTRYIKEQVNERLNAAIDKPNGEQEKQDAEESQSTSDVVTTDEEMYGYRIIRALLKDAVELDRIAYRDYKGHFSVLLDGSAHQLICRLHFNGSRKQLGIPDDDKSEQKHDLENIEDVANYKKELEQSVKRLLGD